MSKKYSVGIDVTYGTYLDVEAEDINEAIAEAKEFAKHLDTPRGCHFVGVATHGERFIEYKKNK
tara:strand:- start:3297 stop:3488 length:192 start_codon:yes stop_codon:yes gene_type:complete